jgi:hypothetical protein
MYRSIALALTIAAFAQHAFCGQFDWPQWQGQDRTAHSKETGLLAEWPKDVVFILVKGTFLPVKAWSTEGIFPHRLEL